MAESRSFGSDFFQPNPTSVAVSKKRYLKRGSNHQFLSVIAKSSNRSMAASLRLRKLSLVKISKGDEASSGLSLKNLVKVCGHSFLRCVSSKKIWSRQLRLGLERKTPPP